MMSEMRPIELAAIEAAQARLKGHITRTPLVPLRIPGRVPGQASSDDIYLKLENLQPIGSFKMRGAGNAMLSADAMQLAGGVVTASAGNMAQGVAWHARRLGIRCRAVVPHGTPDAKIDAIHALGGETIPVTRERWWQTMTDPAARAEFADALFLHPVADAAVLAGNGTIGLELLEDLPDLTAVYVPFGGGGLVSGIASALRAKKPGVRIIACEVEGAAPLAASLANGRPTDIEPVASFVDGIGGPSVLPEMWPLVSDLVDEVRVVPPHEIASALRMLALGNRVVAEGAGATSVAAALAAGRRERGDQGGTATSVCIVSGGHIGAGTLAQILTESIP